MSVHSLKKTTHISSINTCAEKPMPHAREVQLPNGSTCMPQHYIQYQHNLVSLQEIISDISFCDNVPIFADEDRNGLFLQVGVVGRENYNRDNLIRPHKIVYGRKWRIEAYTPTSEVIQTAFLAIKKAREHEVRELLTLQDSSTGKQSAAFSSHHDLPLMARNTDLFDGSGNSAEYDIADISLCISTIRFGQRVVRLIDCTKLKNGTHILELQLDEAPLVRKLEGDMPEFDQARLSLLCKKLNRNELLHEIMDNLIQLSDRHVAEHFQYQGFSRFSRQLDPFGVAKLSIACRPYSRDKANATFSKIFFDINNQVDVLRVPAIGFGTLAKINVGKLGKFNSLIGHMPKGYLSQDLRQEVSKRR
ncbi:hypothetical protein ACO0LF_30805 [Undibacterium sp. Di27W]|uniref:hypothetical protein n=1 Tax=Undibacterium sp. Di27W TaxID=3413036 RepID=UPI003BF27F73